MARWDRDDVERYDDDWDDEDGGSLNEWDDDESTSTIECPYCQAEIHEDSERCPVCEQYLSREDAPTTPRPWLVMIVLVCVALILLGLLPYCGWILVR